MYQDIYNCTCQNTKKKYEDILSIMSNLQPNCCLKVDFQKVCLPLIWLSLSMPMISEPVSRLAAIYACFVQFREGNPQIQRTKNCVPHYDGRALRGNPGLQYPHHHHPPPPPPPPPPPTPPTHTPTPHPPPPLYIVQCTQLITAGRAPHLYNRGSSM